MLALRNPQEAYRRVDFDARIASAKPGELVVLCLEQFVAATSSALLAHERANNSLKSQAITRALSAVTALQMGLDGNVAISGALAQFYGAARRTLLDSVLRFDVSTIKALRQDFIEVSQALAASARGA
ncbi:MAG: flagellar protein FliS [Novosphingobium sp.]